MCDISWTGPLNRSVHGRRSLEKPLNSPSGVCTVCVSLHEDIVFARSVFSVLFRQRQGWGLACFCANWILPSLNEFPNLFDHGGAAQHGSHACMHACGRAGLLLQIAGGPCSAALTAASVNTRTYFITVLIYQEHIVPPPPPPPPPPSSSWHFLFFL